MTTRRKIIVSLAGLVFALAIAAAWFGYTVVKTATPREVEPDSVILGVNFVGIYVDDVEAAGVYYASSVSTETVDAPVLETSGLLAGFAALDSEDAEAQSKLIRSANAQLLLMSSGNRSAAGAQSAAVPVNGPGIAHVCFQVDRATNAYNKMVAAGASTIGAPELIHLNPGNPVYYGYLADPSGVITEIEEIDVAALDLPEPPSNQYRIRHVSLATADLDAMIDFYQVFLGDQEPRHIGWLSPYSGETVDQVSGLEGSEMEMAWFQIRNLELEIFQYHSHLPDPVSEPRPIDAPGYNMIVLDVSDLAAAKKRLLDAGGKLVREATPFADGEAIFGRDPDGNLLVLHKVAASSPFSAKNFADNGI